MTFLNQTRLQQQIHPRVVNPSPKSVLEMKHLVKKDLTFYEIGAKLGYAAATVKRKFIEHCDFRLTEIGAPKNIGRISKQKNDSYLVIMDILFRIIHISLLKIQMKPGISGENYNIWTLNNWVAGTALNFTIKPGNRQSP